MAIRPADLQQVVLKAPDVTRDAAAQQEQGAAAQQTAAADQSKRHAQATERVEQFDEAGAAAIHERRPRSDAGQHQPGEEDDGSSAEEDQQTGAADTPQSMASPVRLGRHIDVRA